MRWRDYDLSVIGKSLSARRLGAPLDLINVQRGTGASFVVEDCEDFDGILHNQGRPGRDGKANIRTIQLVGSKLPSCRFL